jgi:hypothetical protein
MLSQDRGDRKLRYNASHPNKLRAQAFPSVYIADTTAKTPEGETIDGHYFNEYIPSGR